MRSLQRGALGALLVTTAFALAACGGGGGSAASTSATTTTPSTSAAGVAGGANSAAFAKYTACLKQNGVTLPNFGAGRPPGGAGGGDAPSGTAPAPPTGTNPPGGQGGPGGFDSAAFRKAAAACAKLRPAGTRGGFGGGFRGGNAQNSAAFAAYRNCLTLHGVKLTDLRRGGAAPTAKQQKALTACASLRPARPSSTTTAPTTTTS